MALLTSQRNHTTEGADSMRSSSGLDYEIRMRELDLRYSVAKQETGVLNNAD